MGYFLGLQEVLDCNHSTHCRKRGEELRLKKNSFQRSAYEDLSEPKFFYNSPNETSRRAALLHCSLAELILLLCCMAMPNIAAHDQISIMHIRYNILH